MYNVAGTCDKHRAEHPLTAVWRHPPTYSHGQETGTDGPTIEEMWEPTSSFTTELSDSTPEKWQPEPLLRSMAVSWPNFQIRRTDEEGLS